MKTKRIFRRPKQWEKDIKEALTGRPDGIPTKELSDMLGVSHCTIYNRTQSNPDSDIGKMLKEGTLYRKMIDGAHRWFLKDPMVKAIEQAEDKFNSVQKLEMELIGVIKSLAEEMGKNQLQNERKLNRMLADELRKAKSEAIYYKDLAETRKTELQAKRSIFGFGS